MTDTVRRTPRSGCAVMMGVLLIMVGTTALAYNLSGFLGFSFVRLASEALSWFGTYWPALLIAWGIYKIYVRVRHPERSYVGAAEVVILAWILVLGLAVRSGERILGDSSFNVTLDEMAIVVGPELYGPEHHFTERQTYTLNMMDGAEVLVIDNDRGEVTVSGWDEEGLEVLITRRVHDFSEIEAQALAEELELLFAVDEGRARLRTSRPEGSRPVFTDLEIRAPKSVMVNVLNERGPIRLNNLDGAAEASTSHGLVEAENLTGGVTVTTSHAPIRLERITGRTEARNRNGAVVATSIDGDLLVLTRNGSVSAEGVTGSATLRTRHANVQATDVKGRVEVQAHDAEVSVERAHQGVAITTRNRPVFVSDVERELTLETRNSSVIARAIRGDVVVENQYRPIRLTEIAGRVRIDGPQCEVDLESIAGSIVIESSDKDVRVTDFASGLEIRSTHAELQVSTQRLAGAVHLETTYGDVELWLPSDASVALTARTRDGELRSELEVLDESSVHDRERQWTATLGNGGYPLTISTSYGNIELRKAPR